MDRKQDLPPRPRRYIGARINDELISDYRKQEETKRSRSENIPINQNQGTPPLPPRYIESSSAKNDVPVRNVEGNEPLNNSIPSTPDITSAVNELYRFSTLDLGRLISNAEYGIIRRSKSDGSTLEINVETFAKYLAKHIMEYSRLKLEPDEEDLRHILGGVRLLHVLCDLAPHYRILEQVLFGEVTVRKDILNLVFCMMTYLKNLGETIQRSSNMAVWYSTLLASSLFLLTSSSSPEFSEISLVLLAHKKVDEFMDSCLTSVGVVVGFLQHKLSAQNTRMKSNMDKVYELFHICEASLQFLQLLCKQKNYREHLELRKERHVLQLVHDILKLPQSSDSYLTEVVYRLKSKVLFIMLCLCEVKNSTFLEISATSSLELACNTVYEVLEVVKMTFHGVFKDHPQGILPLYAMRITEIFADNSNYRAFTVLNLTDVLSKVFLLPESLFKSSWCSYDNEPAEEDTVKDYDSLLVSGKVLDVYLTLPSRKQTLSPFSLPPNSYARHRSALLVKIVAHLSCIVPGLPQEDNGPFITEFLSSLEETAAQGGGGEIRASVSRNLSSFLGYAEFLVPRYLNEEDVNVFREFYSRVEDYITSLEPKVKEVDNNGKSSLPTPRPQNKGVSFTETGHNTLNGVETEDQRENVNSGAQIIETNRIQNVEAANEKETARSLQSEKKRKRHTMNPEQISMIEKAVRDDPDMQKKPVTLQLLADNLSLKGSEVSLSQLKNWLNNHRRRQARAAAEDLNTPSQINDLLTETQISSRKSPVNEFLTPSSSTPQGTHQNEVLRTRGPESSQTITISTPQRIFKRGQNVTLTNEQGEEIGKGSIHLANGTWFGDNLKELGLCVVDVNELRIGKRSYLPRPSKDTGETFGHAEQIFGRKRILWERSKLQLIRQQIS